MPGVIAFGESLVDLVYRGDVFIGANPGGSVLNTSVSLARSGIEVELVSEFASDNHGLFLRNFLQDNGIGIRYCSVYAGHRTASARANLDVHGNARYFFDKDYPAVRFPNPLPQPGRDTILLFGSFSSLDLVLQPTLDALLEAAHVARSLVFYDPNIRQHHFSANDGKRSRVLQFMAQADIVRASDEDMVQIFGTHDISRIWGNLEPKQNRLLVITHGGSHAEAFDGVRNYRLEAPEISVVSTIGAGDAFNAGMISGLINHFKGASFWEVFPEDLILKLLQQGMRYASVVCQTTSNFIDEPIV
jgi:fructokinase